MKNNPNVEVLVLDSEGTNLGRMPYADAKSLAQDRDLDLVQIDKGNKVQVFKIMNYGKYKYDKKKHKQKKTTSPTKEMSFKLRIDPHDQEIKINRIKHFLQKGSDVKITVTLKGREKAAPQFAHEKLDEIIAELKECAIPLQRRSSHFSVSTMIRPCQEKRKGNDSHTTGNSGSPNGEHSPLRDSERNGTHKGSTHAAELKEKTREHYEVG